MFKRCDNYSNAFVEEELVKRRSLNTCIKLSTLDKARGLVDTCFKTNP